MNCEVTYETPGYSQKNDTGGKGGILKRKKRMAE